VGFEFASLPQKLGAELNEISFFESCKRVFERPTRKRSDSEREKLPLWHPFLLGKLSGKFLGKPFEIPGSLERPSLSKIYAK
jgi:hypothetical protein